MRFGRILVGVAAGLIAVKVAATPQRVIQSATDIVRLYVSVNDKQGRRVDGLTLYNFTVRDNGFRRYPTLFAHDRQSVSAALVLDLSGSMTSVSDQVRRGAREFAAAMLPGDRATVTSLWRPSFRFASTPAQLSTQIEQLTSAGDSPIWDTIELAVDALQLEPEPRLLVVFTDGEDTRHLRPRVLSEVYGPDLIASRVSKTGVRLVVVTYKRPSGEFIQAIEKSDGLLVTARGAEGLPEQFRRAVDDMHHAYLIGFSPATDGKQHKLSVTVDRKGVTVRARKSYLGRR